MDQHIKHLLRKYILKECTPEEMSEVVQFFKNSRNSDVELLPDMDEVLQMIGEKQHIDQKSANRIFRNILTISAGRKRKNSWRRNSISRLSAAAVLAAIICSVFFLQQNGGGAGESVTPPQGFVTIKMEDGQQKKLRNGDSLQIVDNSGNLLGFQKGSSIIYTPEKEITSLRYNTVSVPYGKRFELSLSDGTRVFLNAGTSLKFPVSFIKGKEREVFLSGEAFFDVTKNESSPFKVNTGKLAVEVLGTEFNVNAYPENKVQKVVLVEGSVKVENVNGRNILMAPNELVSSDGGAFLKSNVIAADFASWKDGYITINNASAANTIKLLENYYNIRIHSNTEKDTDEIIGSGKVYLSEEVENVIATLSLLTRNNYSFEYLNSKESPSK